MNDELKIIGARAIADIVRDAVQQNPSIDADALKNIAEAVAEAIAAGVAKLNAAN